MSPWPVAIEDMISMSWKHGVARHQGRSAVCAGQGSGGARGLLMPLQREAQAPWPWSCLRGRWPRAREGRKQARLAGGTGGTAETEM